MIFFANPRIFEIGEFWYHSMGQICSLDALIPWRTRYVTVVNAEVLLV